MRFLRLILTGTLAIATPPAWSQSCTVTTSALEFSTYDLLSALPTDAHGSVNVSCSSGTMYVIRLDAGSGGTAAFSPRQLTGDVSADALNYNIYVDAARTQVFGDGTSGTVTVVGLGSGATQIHQAYGRIPARQKVGPGRYGDALAVSVDW